MGVIAAGVVAVGGAIVALSPKQPPAAQPAATTAPVASSATSAPPPAPSPSVESDALGLPAVALPATALARTDGQPLGIAVNRDSIYWMSGQRLMMMPKRGGDAVTIAKGAGLAQLVADDSGAYWISYNRLEAFPHGGTRVIDMFTLPNRYLDGLALDEGWVYSGVTDGHPYIWRAAKVRAQDQQGAPDAGWPPRHRKQGLVLVGVDATHIYCLTPHEPPEPSRPRAGPHLIKLSKTRAEAEPITVATDLDTAARPFVRGPRVFYTDLRKGTVVMTTGAPRVETILASNQKEPGAVIADDRFAYWVDLDGVMRVALSGGAPERVALERRIWRLAQDEANIYWISDTSVARVPKQARAAGTEPPLGRKP